MAVSTSLFTAAFSPAASLGSLSFSNSPRPSASFCQPSTRPARFCSLSRKEARAGRKEVVVAGEVASTERQSAEKVEWKVKRETLLKNGVKSIPVKEAHTLLSQGGEYTLLDVRPQAEFQEVRAAGSRSAEVYRLIREWTAWDVLRRLGFAFFGVFNGTEENPDFIREVEALGLAKDSKIIVACAFGGTLKPSQNFTQGKESRSLIAAYVLSTSGYTNVFHLEGGLSTWFREDLPVE